MSSAINVSSEDVHIESGSPVGEEIIEAKTVDLDAVYETPLIRVN